MRGSRRARRATARRARAKLPPRDGEASAVRPRMAGHLAAQFTSWCSRQLAEPGPGRRTWRAEGAPLTCIRAWPCRSCGTARSRSRWRSTRWCRTRRRLPHSSGLVMPSAPLRRRCQMMASSYPLLYGTAVHRGQVFEKGVELRGLEPLAFWMQTRVFACFYVAGRCLTVRLPAEIVADCRWASLRVWLRWLFVWLF